MGRTDVFVGDANVVIDYEHIGLRVLGQFSLQIGTVFVPRLILADELGIAEGDLNRVGIEIVDIETEVLLDAQRREAGSPLTVYDWVCLLEAKRRGAVCLTSDGALIRMCGKEDVAVKRGLAPLLDLATIGVYSTTQARRFAELMAEQNPFLVKVLPAFEQELSKVSRRRRR